jgi:hypothetical protein
MKLKCSSNRPGCSNPIMWVEMNSGGYVCNDCKRILSHLSALLSFVRVVVMVAEDTKEQMLTTESELKKSGIVLLPGQPNILLTQKSFNQIKARQGHSNIDAGELATLPGYDC